MKLFNGIFSVQRTPVILSVAALALSGPALVWAQTIIAIPTLGGSSLAVYALNDQGQVAGLSGLAGDLEQRAFVYGDQGLVDWGGLGGIRSQATAINRYGEVAGDATTPSGFVHAVASRGGVLVDLGTLGGSMSVAMAINDAGQVTGYSSLANESDIRSFLARPDGSMIELPSLGGFYSNPIDLNNAGQVAGESWTEGDMEIHPFLYTDGEVIDLGTLGGSMAFTFDLNDQGMVVGDSMTRSGAFHAYLWVGGTMFDLGTLGGSSSQALAVNEAGQVAGNSLVAGDAATHAFLHAGGTMIDLGTLGGSSSYASDLNDHGQVIGDSYTASGWPAPFLWEKGAMVNLNSLLPPDSGWVLYSAFYINNAGQVVGYGFLDGVFSYYRLTLSSPNNAPVAVAGPDLTLECPGTILLDGSASHDPDGDELAYAWSSEGVLLGQSSQLSVDLLPGRYVIDLTVSDPEGATAQDALTVLVADQTPPLVSAPLSQTLAVGDDGLAAVPILTHRVVATDNCTAPSDLARSQNPAPGLRLGVGEYEVVVTVADSSGNTASAVTRLQLVDVSPPTLSGCPDHVALIPGPDGVADTPDLLSQITVTDNVSAPAALILEQTPPVGTPLAVGLHLIVVSATDAAGNRGSCSVPVEVSQPCEVTIESIAASPAILSPANRKMQPVSLEVLASNSCGTPVVASILAVTSSEPVTGQGDDTAPDWEVTGALTVNLRAETAPQGDGRIYWIEVLCVDEAGHQVRGTVAVPVVKGKIPPRGKPISVPPLKPDNASARASRP